MRMHLATAAFAVVAACGPINRVALPSPFPLTSGGTPTPAEGFAPGLTLNDALRGQEVQRTELTGGSATAGFDDRFNISAAVFGGHLDGDPSGSQFSAKLRIGSPLGPRTSTAVHAAYATVARTETAATIPQDERVRVYDLAVPSEFLLTDAATTSQLSAYVGPRITIERYDDYLNPGNDFHHTYLGIVGGLHGRVGHLHLFAEATIVHVPAVNYLGTSYGDRWTVLPNIAASFTFGRSHRWPH